MMFVALVLLVLLASVFAATLRIVGIVSCTLVARVVRPTAVASAAAMVLSVVLVMLMAALVRVLANLFVLAAWMMALVAWDFSTG